MSAGEHRAHTGNRDCLHIFIGNVQCGRKGSTAMPRVLLYHDVVDGNFDASGFPGGGAASYKLGKDKFLAHLKALTDIGNGQITTISEMLQSPALRQAASVLLTFDDGGVSAMEVADQLELFGWRGHFFITTDFIGAQGFLHARQVRELDQRGHIIGSHSASHPERMTACGRSELISEWQRSREALSDIVVKPINVASVPGGYYSGAGAEAAAQVGLTDLFNSEPTTRVAQVGGCRVYGRYTIYRGTTPASAAAFAAGSTVALLMQAAAWNAKKILKRLGGRGYLAARQWALDHWYR
jgi:peptidoglycan/xylan/chitin deacetylase (PgdA/CDA1 family)